MDRKKSLKVELNPEVLLWAIASSGWDEKDLITKLKISQTTFNGWKSGRVNPTIR